ncbi:sn1-specific diacylglycerol lipase [Apostasia shenzhenica]|uniref:Sn1-specific diacylglycerol lipase n=1 Tax=Apostasia shenzhenica TaxID=1088818 RepID=A0A2I0A3D3_9ASPA|nr:sn1-specific diacylglycerol lipase [Apostasia shenzhenica]
MADCYIPKSSNLWYELELARQFPARRCASARGLVLVLVQRKLLAAFLTAFFLFTITSNGKAVPSSLHKLITNSLLYHADYSLRLDGRRGAYGQLLAGLLNRCLSQESQGEEERLGILASRNNEGGQLKPGTCHPELVGGHSDDDDSSGKKWKVELAWLSRALEPALQLYKRVSIAASGEQPMIPPSTRSLSEILTDLQVSRTGIQDWSLSELTLGLYLIYLSQTSAAKVEDFNGVQITSDSMVQELIYHNELARGCYKDSPSSIARYTLLRERNIVKFVKDSSLLRPGYYIGLDTRNKLVIFGIRGTHTVYDLITNVVSSSDQNMSFEGFSTHFGTAEAARWFLHHEMETIRRLLEKHKGFRLRLVGHSLGGAAAALLAIMLRRRSAKELGFSPDIISAVGFGTLPCVSRELAESCVSYVSTIVLQDDVIPRLSVASLARLRNEILEIDWMAVLEKEDWKGFVELVANAKQVVSSVQDVARKLAEYAKFMKRSSSLDIPLRKDLEHDKLHVNTAATAKQNHQMSNELFLPGSQYFLKREIDESRTDRKSSMKSREYYTLWKRNPGEHFNRILLSSNLISDHKCESHYFALRDVLKGLPTSDSRSDF